MTYGFASLLPPLFAIALALISKRVLMPLAAGVLIGAGLLALGGVAATPAATGHWTEGWVWQTFSRFAITIWDSVWDVDHLMVLLFTLLLGGMVGVMESTGTMRAAIGRLALRIRDARGVQTLIAASGLAVFFDDYANTLLVGGTMRSTADRFGISRAKLAYLVDSTAAPVAGLAIVSTWVATEISYLQLGIDASGDAGQINAFEFFISSIPYRFYPWLAIVMVFLIVRSGRDFGPMVGQERKAAAEHRERRSVNDVLVIDPMRHPFMSAILPVVMCLIAVFVVLLVTGMRSVGSDRIPSWSTSLLSFIRQTGDWIGNGNSYLALVVGGAAGLISAIAIGFCIRCGSKTIGSGVLSGVLQMMPAMAVLWLAWALSSITDQLDTGGYLSSILSDRLDVRFLPTCVFILGGFIAFSTGTSWGTMAILTPIAVSLVLDMQSVVSPGINSDIAMGIAATSSPIALATFGSVLAGAIFGDHCSPISDTTVLSSRACGCDHVTHVTTQMPYALSVGGVCIVTGTIPVAFGVPVWICLAAGVACLWTIVRCLGRTVELDTGRDF